MSRIDKARAFRAKQDAFAQRVPDDVAATAPEMFPAWSDSAKYETGYKVRYGGLLYRCLTPHTAQANWTPDVVPAIWVAISDGSKSGAKDSPIDAVRGMEYVKDLHYLDPEDGKTYLCTRAGVLQYLPHELIGHYFEGVA